MTTRLYYSNSYQSTFDAIVVSCELRTSATTDGARQYQEASGDARPVDYGVVLDRTAFYPTSGGQPFDIGSLGDAAVRDVIEREDGEIVHVVDRQLSPGAGVRGAIDWRRRFDHMQQHTGQHVLSAAFDHVCRARTESFHLGTLSATIDLAREVSPAQIRSAEDEANRVVWEDRPVAVKVVSAEESKALPLRKESVRTGPLRLIEVQDFDLSACGGTHVSSTGAIGIVAIAGWEKFRGGTRVEFLCGARALARFREWREALTATTRHLSVQVSELPGAVEKLQADAKALQKTIRGQREQLAQYEARSWVARAERVGGRLLLVDAPDGWDAAGLKPLAVAAAALEPTIALAFLTRTQPAQAVVAAGSASGVDAAAVLKDLTARFGGRGGGKRELAQGGGLVGSLAELTAAARAALEGPTASRS